MTTRSRAVRWWLAALVLGAGCREGTPVPTGPAREPAPPPAVAAARATHPEGYATPGPTGQGWILDRRGQPLAVTYEVHGDLAVWQGDIVIGRAGAVPATREALLARRPAGPRYGVVTTLAGRVWPNGIVPYEIAGDLPDQSRVTDAIALVEKATAGVVFVPRSGQADYVRFVTSDGCSSDIGRVGGQQAINLGDGCTTGNAAHEILHALGMFHEQSRCDRDTYVEIHLENVESGKENNFDKECTDARDFGDYAEGSMMHYGPTAFSKNGLATIVSKRGRDGEMGQRSALGPTDIATINDIYAGFNDAPTASFTAPASAPEGSSVAFDGSGSSDPDDPALASYSWTFGDGTTGTGATTSHTYADNGVYTVTLTVSDGFLTNSTSRAITVTNVAPTVSVGGAATRDEGQLLTRAGSFTDPGSDSWTATVNYGDGTGTQPLALSGKTFALSHTYADNGVYTVTVQVRDDDAGSGGGTFAVTVSNVAPTVDAGPNLTVESGKAIAFAGAFSDPGVVDYPWSWSIAWGFGSNTTGSTNTQGAITASKQACAAGTYTITLSVTDKDGGTGSDVATLTVPFRSVGIDVSPTEHPNPINLSKKGLLPVALLGSATLDASTVDPTTVMLGDGTGIDVPVARANNGRLQARLEDVNGDGRLDLLMQFEVPALVAGGEVTLGTTELVLRAFLADGCTNVRGANPVVVRP